MDAVVTWVDGSDAAYQTRRAAEGARRGMPLDEHTARGTTARDELRYCLRGLVQHAPWLRRIVLVTDGQWPRWLDEAAAAAETPPIVRVDHSALHPEGRSMYGSTAVEAVLHRIPGLSDLFLFANSDMYLTAPLEEADLVRTLSPSPAAGATTRRVGLLRASSGVLAAHVNDGAARTTLLTERGEWERWLARAAIDQLRVFERVSRGAAPRRVYPLAQHQMQVLCRDCIAYACDAEPALWRATADTFGRPQAQLDGEPRHLGRVCFETLAVWRGHCAVVQGGDDAAYLTASEALDQLGGAAPPPRFLCVNNVESEHPSLQAAVLGMVQRILPRALACESSAPPPPPAPDDGAACWTAEQLAGAVPDGIASLAVVAAAPQQGDWRGGTEELVQQLRARVDHVLVLYQVAAPSIAASADSMSDLRASDDLPSGSPPLPCESWLRQEAAQGSVAVAAVCGRGREWGMWARALRELRSPLRRLVLATDAAHLLPHRELDALFQHPRARGADAWAITESASGALQSVMIAADGGAAVTALEFMRRLKVAALAVAPPAESREGCEAGLTQALRAGGHAVASLYPRAVTDSMRSELNAAPTPRGADRFTAAWDRLVLLGCPLLARGAVRYDGADAFLARLAALDAAAAAERKREAAREPSGHLPRGVAVVYLPKETVRLRAPCVAGPIPRRIWSYWEGPLNDVVAACFASWRAHNPEWEVTVLNPATLHDFVVGGVRIEDTPTFLVKPTRTANWARVHVLAEHGGVWLDASVLLHGSLDWVQGAHAAATAAGGAPPALIGWRRRKYSRTRPVLESWGFAAPPGSPFVAAWRDEARRYGNMTQEAYGAHMVRDRGLDLLGLPPQYVSYLSIYLAAMAVFQGVAPCAPCSVALLDAEDGPFAYMRPDEGRLRGGAAALVKARGAPPSAHAPFSKLRECDRTELSARPDRAAAWAGHQVDALVAATEDEAGLRACLASLAAHAQWLRRIRLARWPPWLDEVGARSQTPPIVRDCGGTPPSAIALRCVGGGCTPLTRTLRLCDVVGYDAGTMAPRALVRFSEGAPAAGWQAHCECGACPTLDAALARGHAEIA